MTSTRFPLVMECVRRLPNWLRLRYVVYFFIIFGNEHIYKKITSRKSKITAFKNYFSLGLFRHVSKFVKLCHIVFSSQSILMSLQYKFRALFISTFLNMNTLLWLSPLKLCQHEAIWDFVLFNPSLQNPSHYKKKSMTSIVAISWNVDENSSPAISFRSLNTHSPKRISSRSRQEDHNF